MHKPLNIKVIRPSNYGRDGYAERFRRGFIRSATTSLLEGLTPPEVNGRKVRTQSFDERVERDLRYLEAITPETCSLLVLAGTQFHEFTRALDLAALAKSRGVNCVIGGPHPITCDTRALEGRGVSFALAEAEVVWPGILQDAADGKLQSVYGQDQRWSQDLGTLVAPSSRMELGRYAIPMMGLYPVRGCPRNCDFCSTVRVAGRRFRSEPTHITLENLKRAKRAGVRTVLFASDNLNAWPGVKDLMRAMIEEGADMPFFAQCDVGIARDEELIELMSRAGCTQMFLGVESSDPVILAAIGKRHNDPGDYQKIVRLCDRHDISTHFSTIVGFPQQERGGVLREMREIKRLAPTIASFFPLVPTPGTLQYKRFREDGLIRAESLDDYADPYRVWWHPNLSAEELESLVGQCYREFYSFPTVARRFLGRSRFRRQDVKFAAYCRYAVSRGAHPMSSGVGRLPLDAANDYAGIRKQVFGIEKVPLPENRE